MQVFILKNKFMRLRFRLGSGTEQKVGDKSAADQSAAIAVLSLLEAALGIQEWSDCLTNREIVALGSDAIAELQCAQTTVRW